MRRFALVFGRSPATRLGGDNVEVVELAEVELVGGGVVDRGVDDGGVDGELVEVLAGDDRAGGDRVVDGVDGELAQVELGDRGVRAGVLDGALVGEASPASTGPASTWSRSYTAHAMRIASSMMAART